VLANNSDILTLARTDPSSAADAVEFEFYVSPEEAQRLVAAIRSDGYKHAGPTSRPDCKDEQNACDLSSSDEDEDALFDEVEEPKDLAPGDVDGDGPNEDHEISLDFGLDGDIERDFVFEKVDEFEQLLYPKRFYDQYEDERKHADE